MRVISETGEQLGIMNIFSAIDLAKYFGSIKKIREAKLEDFENILDIGPVVARSIFEWFHEKPFGSAQGGQKKRLLIYLKAKKIWKTK